MSRLQNTQYVLEGLPELMKLDTGLRKSQRRVLKTYLEADMDKKQTGIFNLATGFGKTRMMSILALAYKRANPDGRVLIVVPSRSLIKDENGDGVVKKFHVYNKEDLKSDSNLDFGTYYGEGVKSTGTEFTVTTYDSLAKYAKKINPKDIGLLLLDEAHHALSEARSETIRQFSNAAQYGMTATPGYDPEKDLKNLLENCIAQVTIEEAIKEGDLADTKNVILVSGTPVDLTKVPKVGGSGDYDQKEYMKAIARAMNGNSIDSGNEDNWKDVHRRISEQIAEFYRDYEDDEAGKIFGKKCMINCRSQEEARITALSINKIFGKMMAATYVSGNKGTENETVLNSFVGGNLPILCQVGKLSEGFNYPDLDIVFNFPTHSRVREAQLGGRAIRTPSDRKRKKTALIVDIAFTHPDGKNVIDAIHKNGQVLFQDIMGEPIIQKDKGPAGGGGRGKGKPTIRLKDFNIISDKKTLFYLSNEAKKIEEERAQEEAELRDGFTSGNVAKILDVDLGTAIRLINRYKDETVINPETGEEEPCTKKMKDVGGNICFGFTRLGFEKALKEYRSERQACSPAVVAKELNITPMKAETLIKYYKDETVINPETGKEEPCIKIVKNFSVPCLAFTKIGLEKAKKDLKEGQEGITMADVMQKLDVSQKPAIRLINRYKNETVFNPETSKEEACVKVLRTDTGKPYLGFTKLGFEKAQKEYKEERQGFTSGDVAKKLNIDRGAAIRLINRYKDETVINPETGEEEPCTKKMKDALGKACLGLTKLGLKKAQKEYQEQQQEYSPAVVAKELDICVHTAISLIKSYKNEIVINPKTGKEESCVKKMKTANGRLCLGFTKLGFKKAQKEYKEEQKGYTSGAVAKKLRCDSAVAFRLIKSYKNETVINPKTGKEESCVKKMRTATGKPCLGLTKLGFERVVREYEEKKERTTSKTLRPRLKAGSTQGKPKAPPVRNNPTPEI